MAGKDSIGPSCAAGPRLMTGPHSALVQMVALLPLVVFYEVAVPFTTLRSHWYHRIDVWSQAVLSKIGLTAYYLPGALILVTLLVIHLWRHDPWRLRLESLGRLWAESVLWTVPLFVLFLLFTLPVGRLFAAELELYARGPKDLFSSVVLAIGSGLFEEFVFRLVLMSLVLWLLQKVFRVPVDAAQLVAVCLTAAAFASAHYFGPGASGYSHLGFLFRAGAGIYLGSVYILRGFATGAFVHAGFNIALALLGMF